MAYVDGFVIPVPEGKKEEYRAMAAKAAPIFREHGALRIVECWGDNLPRGKITDFYMAAKAEEGENVVFSWIVYPSKEVRDAANAAVMADPRLDMENETMPFDGKRMFWGGFDILLDTGPQGEG